LKGGERYSCLEGKQSRGKRRRRKKRIILGEGLNGPGEGR